MPVFSYLATPLPGRTDLLVEELNQTPYCEALASDNQELVVLVTETPDAPSEKVLQKRLNGLSHIQHLSMAFGHDDSRH